jgi:polysaccharide export outer membrane protein
MRMRRAASVLCLGLCAAAARAEEPYLIGAEDVLKVVVLGQAEMSGDFAVDASGEITFPILGKIALAGQSTLAAEDRLSALLADGYLKHPNVSITVKEYRSQRVFVTGEVQKPGTYALKADHSLLALFGDVGSLGPEAGHEIVVIRPPRAAAEAGPVDPANAVGAEMFHVTLEDLRSSPEKAVELRAGDTVFVPRAARIFVTGQVGRQGSYRYEEGMSVLQAVTLAGGVTDRGSSKRIRILRSVAGKKQELKAKLSDLVAPGDTLVVPERFF